MISDFANAVRDGNIKQVRVLLAGGGDVNVLFGSDALQEASYYGRIDIVKVLIEAGAHAEEKALWAACEYGYVDVAKALIDAGADVHTYGRASLKRALANGYKGIISLLLAHGADADAATDEEIAAWKKKQAELKSQINALPVTKPAASQ